MGSSLARRRIRSVLLWLVALCYALSIPWYRGESDALRVVLGLPDWVAVALACYVAAACFNSLAWLLTDVSDGAPEREAEPEEARRSGASP